MITDDQIKTLHPEVAATWIVGAGAPLSEAQRQVLAIACRNGGYVEAGTGAHKGHVEHVSASALLALVRRGYLTHCYGSEGGVAGQLSASAREKLAAATAAKDPNEVTCSQCKGVGYVQMPARQEACPDCDKLGKVLIVPRSDAPRPRRARHGVWTPWAQVLCVACEYRGLKGSPSATTFASRVQKLAAMPREDEISQPDSETLIGTCDGCGCACWVRDDVALLQRLGRRATDRGFVDVGLEQTGGMCAALAIDTPDRRIRVTAEDGGFAVCEYARVEGEWWDHLRRMWESEALYEDGAWKPDPVLDAAIETCLGKVTEFTST